MSENPVKEKMNTKPEETEEPKTSKKQSCSSEKEQEEQTETTKRFCKNIINKVEDVEMGVLFAGVESLCDNVKKCDTRITLNVNGLLSKVTGYFRNSIDSYKEARKKIG